MWHRTDAVLARADVRGDMASNTTEEPKVPQVVSAYSEKKSRAMWHRADAVLALADVRGHMASNEAWNRRFRRWCLLIQKRRAEPCGIVQTPCLHGRMWQYEREEKNGY